MLQATDERPNADTIRRLRETIIARSIVTDKTQPILSPNGLPNQWLIDLRATFLDPASLDAIAELFWRHFADRLPFQVGAIETSAIPLVSAIQLKGLQRNTPVNGFIVRKERKHYGLNKVYEGRLTDEPIVV